MSESPQMNQIAARFMRSIIPQGYHTCLSSCRNNPGKGRPKKPWTDKFVGPKANGAFEKHVDLAVQETDTDHYYGLAGYRTGTRRTQKNVAAIKVMVIDADFKPKDGYFHEEKEAYAALAELKKAVPQLPDAGVVHSGGGLHVYYRFDDDLTPAEWEPLVNMFVRVARDVDPRLMAEPQSTRDSARVFRIPLSCNAKEPGNPRRSKILRFGTEAPMADVKAGLTRAMVDRKINMQTDAYSAEMFPGAANVPAYVMGVADDMTFGEKMSRNEGQFIDLPIRPMIEGCKQVHTMITKQEDVTNPEWYLLLRLMNTTRDPEANAHNASKNYPGYNKAHMLRQLHRLREETDAPTVTCAEFETLQPERCKGCPNKGCWSPAKLSMQEVQQTEQKEAKEEAREKAAAGVTTPSGYIPQPSYVKQHTVLQGNGYAVTMLDVTRGSGKNTKTTNEQVFDAHLHLVGCSDMLDLTVEDNKEVTRQGDRFIHFDVVHGKRKDPLVVPSRLLTKGFYEATEMFRDKGITFARDPAAQRAILDYLNELNQLASTRVKLYRPDKGWIKTGGLGHWRFVAGTRTFNPDGTITRNYNVAQHRGLSSKTAGYMERVCTGVSVGELNRWQRGMEVYNGRGLGVAHLLLLSGLTNLLFPLLMNESGGIVLSLTGESGAGKTSLLQHMASFFGDHNKYRVPGTSTENAVGALLKEANCLVLPVDDTVQPRSETLGNLLSLVSGGMEKLRMNWDSKLGTSIHYDDGFNASLLMTSNYDIKAELGAGGKHSQQMQGEAARSRILEVPHTKILVPDHISKGQWRKAKRLISNNYGHAAPRFLQYVVQNQLKIKSALEEKEEQFAKALALYAPANKGSQVRFWARWLAASAVTAKVVCDKLNLLPWNVNGTVNAGMELARAATSEAEESDTQLVEAFWSIFQDPNPMEPMINRLHRVGQKGAWDWKTAGHAQRKRYSEYISDHPAQPVNDANYKVILEETDIMENGVPILRERVVFIQLLNLRDWVTRSKGPALPVTDWSDLAQRLLNVGCVIRGVKKGEPNVMDSHARIQIDLKERPNGKSHPRLNVLEIRLPPVKIS